MIITKKNNKKLKYIGGTKLVSRGNVLKRVGAIKQKQPHLTQKSIETRRREHNSAVQTVINHAQFLKQTALTRYATPTGARTSYNIYKVKEFLKSKGHSNNVANRVAKLIRDRGISNAAKSSGLLYNKQQMQTTANYLLQKSESIRGFHNTLHPQERSQFINFVNQELNKKTNITPQNTKTIIDKYKEQYGTYFDPRTLNNNSQKTEYMNVR
jgi:hypothetical protein